MDVCNGKLHVHPELASGIKSIPFCGNDIDPNIPDVSSR